MSSNSSTSELTEKTQRINNTLADLHAKDTVKDEAIFNCFANLYWPKIDEFSEDTEHGPVFKVAKLAQWVSENHPFKTDVTTGILYFFNGKSWIPNAEPYLEKIVSLCLRDDNKKSIYENTAFILHALTYDKIQFSNKVSCSNGILDVETGEFKPFSADCMAFYKIDTAFNPDAKCPKFEAFVSQVVASEDIPTLQEWSGYCLLTDYRYHKILWIIGSGRNGKGVWQRTIEGILGHESVSNVGLEEFDGNHPFSIVNLYGRLANFCSEPRTSKDLQTNLLKYATGQDTIYGEMKNKQNRLVFTNAAKISVAANKFPKCRDQSTGWLERILFLKFPYEFTGIKQIQNLERLWLDDPQEKSGILNWMLTGLKRLIEQGHFTSSHTQEEAEQEYLRASDSLTAFIKEASIFEKTSYTTRADTWNAYNAYCDFYGLEADNEKKLCAKLKETPRVKDTNIRIEGKQVRVWKGVTFKTLSEDEPQEDTDNPLNQATLEQTLKSGTDGTDGTRILNNLEFPPILKELQTPVPTVPSVPKLDIITLDDKNVILYRRLGESEKSRCEGTTKEGLQCPHLAEYQQEIRGEASKYNYCPECNTRLLNESKSNGFKIGESQPPMGNFEEAT